MARLNSTGTDSNLCVVVEGELLADREKAVLIRTFDKVGDEAKVWFAKSQFKRSVIDSFTSNSGNTIVFIPLWMADKNNVEYYDYDPADWEEYEDTNLDDQMEMFPEAKGMDREVF